MKRSRLAFAATFLALLARPALGDPAPFDLAGPNVRVTVTRKGVTLPIGAVPQLAAGDTLKVEAVLPRDERVHYLMVVAALREPTNPPPDNWFKKSETWKRPGHGGGPIEYTVQTGAEHVVLFLAPATGGDFPTLRKAVQSRPGAFVRASQDLEQASLELRRYDAYLANIRKIAASSPNTLAQTAPIVASSLRVKINEDCLQRDPEFQASCLLDAKQASVLGNGDASGNSSISTAATDLALSLSATPAGGLGYFSPYISAIHEIIGIFGAMRTAKYQYIPALGVSDRDTMALALNTPPSFANPKSVLMAAMPEVKLADPPALGTRPSDDAPCLGNSALLPVTIGPLFYATDFAHDLALQVHLPKGGQLDLPLTPDVARGGLVISAPASLPAGLSGQLSATVHGMWGFQHIVGPEVTLETAGNWHWKQADVGNDEGSLLLTGAPASCITAVSATSDKGREQPLSWKILHPNVIAVSLPPSGPGSQQLPIEIAGPAATTASRVTVTLPSMTALPIVQVVAHDSEPPPAGGASPLAIVLDSPDEISAETRLNFTLKASGPLHFTSHEAVEISAGESGGSASLTIGNGLTLVDPETMIASLTPAQAMGASAFGPLRARLVRGAALGDWLSLGTLVRLPKLTSLTCTSNPASKCTLSGDRLYLLGSVSSAQDFDGSTSVPNGYPGFMLTISHPAEGKLFVRLHDAPEMINHVHITSVATK